VLVFPGMMFQIKLLGTPLDISRGHFELLKLWSQTEHNIDIVVTHINTPHNMSFGKLYGFEVSIEKTSVQRSSSATYRTLFSLGWPHRQTFSPHSD